MTGLLSVVLTTVVSNSEAGENESKGAKDEGLDSAYEKLEAVKHEEESRDQGH